ncbi:MAG: thiamine diphosphokinase [Candidatus Thermofonsia Clade 1 bacterium]|jgi:thiamine pyrophosphokinase|uniref:Thiamine diphosphokinase n=1 Tax=Candidatus Thermofonsia Clade 1 bacterium TaxID=2364210 RepID=A0A2M8PXJ1_9CHLR|nr:MAG: thiamine diphosphokinase [Candidatus Thermofonsia Clade 1 bacterium]PJF42265.1 MAG: thiamine diphosphokinase [Candidatus Thermofonsia Clade 1 bacterium]RMF52575.1 MAG: thiamine diphosphokinase [Chloroflexota bacterium]
MLDALIFLNGDLQDGSAVRAALKRAETQPHFVIAADGGLRHVYALGLRPDLVIGDMDSVSPDQLARAKAEGADVRTFPTHKDETDLELAVLAAYDRGCQRLWLFAAIGDRLDQTLSNVQLLALPKLAAISTTLISGAQRCWLARPPHTEVHGQIGDTLSLLPLTAAVHNIHTEGLYYPLHGEPLHFGTSRGISNVLTAPQARISFTEGLLLVIHTLGKA